jgi:hypothetical protein
MQWGHRAGMAWGEYSVPEQVWRGASMAWGEYGVGQGGQGFMGGGAKLGASGGSAHARARAAAAKAVREQQGKRGSW